MNRTLLTLSLVLAIAPAALAQDKPAVAAEKPAAAQDGLSEREKSVLGVYKSEMPGAPVITIKAMGKQLVMAATGFPELPVTLDDKWVLSSAVLPADYAFTIVRDKDGKVTGLDVKTPMGGGVFARQEEPKKPEAPAVPDILGKYEPDAPGPIGAIEIKFEDGKLVSEVENQPSHTFKLGAKDEVIAPDLPAGVTATFVRDKDGKVTGLKVEAEGTTLTFTRKTFPKPPAAKPVAPAVPDVLGKYEPDEAGPVGAIEVKFEKGKLISEVENQPTLVFKVGPNDEVVTDSLPAGVTAKFVKDKDGKVTGLKVEANGTTLTFTRKTFPKPPAAPAEDPNAKLKAVTGTYKSDIGGVPVVTITLKDGRLIVQAEGNPEVEVKLGEKDQLTGPGLPEGFVLTLIRDKDGKVTGMHVETPMGAVDFTRTPLPEEKKPVEGEKKPA